MIPPAVQTWGLGTGEAPVLAQSLARQRSVAVLDDSQARMCASVLGMSVIGTLGSCCERSAVA